MLCCLVRSEHIKWVMVLDRRCVLCRTAWWTGGSYRAEVWGRHPGASKASCRSCWWRWWWFGWCVLLCCVQEHPPFVLFLSSYLFLLLWLSLFCLPLSVSLLLLHWHTSVNGWVKRQWAYMLTLKTTVSHTFINPILSIRSEELRWLVDYSIRKKISCQLIW